MPINNPSTGGGGIVSYTSPPQAWGSGVAITLAHGLGVVPKLIQVFATCLTAEFNYSVGDIVSVPQIAIDSTTVRGMSLSVSATDLNIKFGTIATPIVILNKTTGATSTLTPASWELTFILVA